LLASCRRGLTFRSFPAAGDRGHRAV
jgi:hypothetical protein